MIKAAMSFLKQSYVQFLKQRLRTSIKTQIMNELLYHEKINNKRSLKDNVQFKSCHIINKLTDTVICFYWTISSINNVSDSRCSEESLYLLQESQYIKLCHQIVS